MKSVVDRPYARLSFTNYLLQRESLSVVTYFILMHWTRTRDMHVYRVRGVRDNYFSPSPCSRHWRSAPSLGWVTHVRALCLGGDDPGVSTFIFLYFGSYLLLGQ